jgi:hypothetical protein
MRIPLVITFLFVSACAPTTDALIDEAGRTGDWAAVNQRFDVDEKRRQSTIDHCGGGRTMLCAADFGELRCSCASNAVAREQLRRITEQQQRRNDAQMGMRH